MRFSFGFTNMVIGKGLEHTAHLQTLSKSAKRWLECNDIAEQTLINYEKRAAIGQIAYPRSDIMPHVWQLDVCSEDQTNEHAGLIPERWLSPARSLGGNHRLGIRQC